jgi:hypothetical protein
MSTPIQQNLVSSNEKYVSSFTSGDLALPPAKKYLVRKAYLFPPSTESYIDHV